MATSFEILCAIIAVACIALYYYFTSTFDFWKNRGVPGPKPSPLTGNIGRTWAGKIHISDFIREICDDYKDEPMIGIFEKTSPILIIKDLELIKDVLITDFSYFSDRGFPLTEKIEPLSQHLFNLEPKRWRPLRIRLSPIFTSGKLKEMFDLMVECGDHLEKNVENIATKGEPVECRELTAKFAMDVIRSCVFGIEMNTLENEDSEFQRMGRAIFDLNPLNVMKTLLKISVPKFYNLLGYVLPTDRLTRFFRGVVVDTIRYRREHKVVRHDFVNFLMELKDNPEKFKDVDLTDDLLTAQAFVFFIAGFETTSATMSHALYELALNPTMQDKLREEINEVYKTNGETLKYDNIKEMVYLDQVFRETLRKYSPLSFHGRKSVANYTFAGTKVSIPKGTRIWIPVSAIQHDPAIYPEPDVFRPERFSHEAASRRHPMSYLPFGGGPRSCIGIRFAVLETKIGLIKTLRKYKVEVCEKTPIPYVKHSSAFFLVPKNGLYLKLTKI